MIQELAIQNFAIISSLQVSFEGGMTVLTGETGAGKSIIIDAVGLLVGGRGSTDYIRQGASKTFLEGQFYVRLSPELNDILTNLEITMTDNVLIVSREITKTGKNVCRINGRLVNTTSLREVGNFLVDIHGQNEHQELMHSESHLHLLDQYGHKGIQQLKHAYYLEYVAYREALGKLKHRQKNEKEFAQRLDMLAFQCEEIEGADLQVGEEQKLLEERTRLSNFHKIAETLKNTYESIQGREVNTLDSIGFAMNEMTEIEELDSDYQRISEALKNSYYQLQEVASEVSRRIDTLEMDEERLNEVETRLDLIRQLKRKYGESEEYILIYFEEISKELAESKALDNQSEELEARMLSSRETLNQFGLELSGKRKRIAHQLELAIQEQLKELYMDKTIFEVRFFESGELDFTPEGVDIVEFYITTNPGEPLKPLIKVASGGELSRIMLALKTIFSQTQGITSIVFDEVDTGVSGRVAQAIANKIYQVARHSQVLCITHLPQVAAVADTQYYIEKEIRDNRTETNLRKLSEKERVSEIARMLSGDEITELTKEHAKELLEIAQKKS